MWADVRTRWVAFAAILAALAALPDISPLLRDILVGMALLIAVVAIVPDLPRIKQKYFPNESTKRIKRLRQELAQAKRDVQERRGDPVSPAAFGDKVVREIGKISPEKARKVAGMMGRWPSVEMSPEDRVIHECDVLIEQLDKFLEDG